MSRYTIDDLDIEVGDLRELLDATHDTLNEMPFERDGRRDEALDRVASLVRIAQLFAERIESNLRHIRQPAATAGRRAA